MIFLRIFLLHLLIALGVSACHGTNKAASAPTAPSGTVTLRWQTGREVQVKGFNVMRSDSSEGPFLAVNGQPIPAAGTSEGPHAYEYVDRNLKPGRIYFYYLSQLLASGEELKLSEMRAFTAR